MLLRKQTARGYCRAVMFSRYRWIALTAVAVGILVAASATANRDASTSLIDLALSVLAFGSLCEVVFRWSAAVNGERAAAAAVVLVATCPLWLGTFGLWDFQLPAALAMLSLYWLNRYAYDPSIAVALGIGVAAGFSGYHGVWIMFVAYIAGGLRVIRPSRHESWGRVILATITLVGIVWGLLLAFGKWVLVYLPKSWPEGELSLLVIPVGILVPLVLRPWRNQRIFSDWLAIGAVATIVMMPRSLNPGSLSTAVAPLAVLASATWDRAEPASDWRRRVSIAAIVVQIVVVAWACLSGQRWTLS